MVFFVVALLSAASCQLHAVPVHAETVEERRAALQAQLNAIESDIANQRGVLSDKQKERASLERDISVLNGKISIAQKEIKARDVMIQQLQNDIGDKETAISATNARVQESEQSVAELLRRANELDELSLPVLVLSDSISAVFRDMDTFQTLQVSLKQTIQQLTNLKADLSARKDALVGQQGEQEDLRRIQVVEKQAIQRRQGEKNQLLTTTKGQEKAYQALIANKEKQAAQIRAALFQLRDSSSIRFDLALQYAQEASKLTGVRPAVILGIIAEESNLGENVGTGTWTVDMKAPRDTEPFKVICAELGLDPNKMPVSKKPWYGWGGAMGPAQFIPSTWAQYKTRIAKISGQNPPNPWDARTAIFAAAMLMADNGADGGTRATERLAALRYLAGWANAGKAAYAFYGNDVMDLADKFQQQIDILGG
jgi:membrane-bound lytic murein transglycosylase B